MPTQQGERRVLRAGAAAAAAVGHHWTAGQGVRRPTHHQLPASAADLHRRRTTLEQRRRVTD